MAERAHARHCRLSFITVPGAGAELVTTFALACELQADWKTPTANDMLTPFKQNLSEYGFVLDNFWNNANQHAVPDPFGMVK